MKTIKSIFFLVVFLTVGLVQTNGQDNKSKDGVFDTVEVMPEYPGGKMELRKDIAASVKYPEEAKKNGIQGKVYVSFVVDEKGKVADVKIARSVDSSLDKEAVRVVESLKTWKPGKEKGKEVKVAYTVPINFVLDKKKKSEDS